MAEQAKIEDLKLKEVPIYRYKHPYGSISVYMPVGITLSPERVLLLLEQAKHDLLTKRFGN